MAVQQTPQVGLSLVNKAPAALAVTFTLLVVALLLSTLHVNVLAYAGFSGVLCGALLLAYWLGKGGMFFVLGILAPLVSVIAIDIPSFTSLFQLILAFFSGFWLLLCVFKLVRSKS